MVGLDEGALTCDLAETYHVFSWRSLPASTAATLAAGLGPDSRIMQKLSGAPAPVNTLLLAMIADSLRVLVWQRTKDGARGKNPPESILEKLYAIQGRTPQVGFDTPEEFMAWRAAMMEG